MSEAFTDSISPDMIATPAIPRITSATRTSTRLSPRSSVQAERPPQTSHLDLVIDAVHRRDQRDGDEADYQPHEDDDERLEKRGELGDLVVQLCLVVLRGEGELGVERAGLLPDAQHRGRSTREQTGAGQRA